MEQKMTIEQVNRALQRKRNWAKAKKILANVFVYFVLLFSSLWHMFFKFYHEVKWSWGSSFNIF